jgi:hypothetical protein
LFIHLSSRRGPQFLWLGGATMASHSGPWKAVFMMSRFRSQGWRVWQKWARIRFSRAVPLVVVEQGRVHMPGLWGGAGFSGVRLCNEGTEACGVEFGSFWKFCLLFVELDIILKMNMLIACRWSTRSNTLLNGHNCQFRGYRAVICQIYSSNSAQIQLP